MAKMLETTKIDTRNIIFHTFNNLNPWSFLSSQVLSAIVSMYHPKMLFSRFMRKIMHCKKIRVSTKFASATFAWFLASKQPSTQESFLRSLRTSSMNGSHIVPLHVIMISWFEVSHVRFFVEVPWSNDKNPDSESKARFPDCFRFWNTSIKIVIIEHCYTGFV